MNVSFSHDPVGWLLARGLMPVARGIDAVIDWFAGGLWSAIR